MCDMSRRSFIDFGVTVGDIWDILFTRSGREFSWTLFFFGLYCNLLEELKLHNPVVASLQDLCILESQGGRRLIRGIRFVFIFFRIIFISFLFAGLHFFGIIGVRWGGHFFIFWGGIGGKIRTISRYFAISLIRRFCLWDTERYVQVSFS